MLEVFVPTLNINEAVARFREAGIQTSETKLGAGIEQGKYPFAICIKIKENRNYEIYTKLLEDYLSERAVKKKVASE